MAYVSHIYSKLEIEDDKHSRRDSDQIFCSAIKSSKCISWVQRRRKSRPPKIALLNVVKVRTTNLQELVYKNGQAGVTKATVSITFDNSNKQQSPMGYESYDEITVTRQVNNFTVFLTVLATSIGEFVITMWYPVSLLVI